MKSYCTHLLSFVFIFAYFNVVAQCDHNPHVIQAQVIQDCIVSAKDTVLQVKSDELNLLINSLKIKKITRPYYFAKTPLLQQIYEFTSEMDADSVMAVFLKHSNLFGIVEYTYPMIPMYDPSDAMWQQTVQDSLTDDYLWSLLKIDADKAWNITKGDPTLVVAVVDNGFDIHHPDLVSKIFPPYDFYTNNTLTTSSDSHGTIVASILASETVDYGETAMGDMASIGYNTKVMVSTGSLPACVYASTVMRAKLISISWFSSCYPYPSVLAAEQEILNNGTVIVKAAGNGNIHCNGGRLYPFSGYEDPRVIVVSSSDFDDSHYFEVNGIDKTHSHYSEVDICAPGYSVMGATNSIDENNNPVVWPYHGQCNGTSFATPLVSGVCALVLSLNPCFAPEDVQDIIKNSADPIVDADDYPGLVGAGRVNAYQALLLAQSYLRPDTITTSTTWNQKKHTYSDIIIDSLATLTITDTLYVAGGSRIIVRPGGKLIVNGGTITNACDGEMWQGIIVEGNANIRQAALAQGSVILNNATIENARDAISTRNANNTNNDEHTGGIIQATNTLFRNNRQSVEFLSYENHTTGGAVTDNVSYFTRCIFTIDTNNLFADNNITFENHLSMWKVRGVKFNGCAFRNGTANHSGKAIYAEEAGFIAKRVCPSASGPQDPCYCAGTATDTVTRCSFTGFDTAVHVAGTNGSYAVTLDNCDFSNNYIGIYLAAADNAQVSFCDFDLDYMSSASTGVYLKNSTGYTVESNSFHRTHYSTLNSVGVCTDNSGTAENVIRLNDFAKLTHGCYAWNCNAETISRPATGLQYACNDFDSCLYSIYVRTAAKIRTAQGSHSVGADNSFYNNIGIGRSITIPSDHTNVSYYYHNSGSHAPMGSSNYTLYQATNANSCTSTLCGLTPLYPRDGLTALEQYLSMAEEYAALVETVRATSLQTDANDLQDETDNADLIGRLSDLSAQMGDLARAEIRTLLNDSVPDMALLKRWYATIMETQNFASPQMADSTIPVAAYQLAETYSMEGDLAAAAALLSSLPQQFTPDEAARNEYANYMALQQLRETVAGNWYTMTDTDIEVMQQVAEYDNGRAARMAKEILCFFHHICYEDELLWDLDGIGERNLQGGRTDGGRTLCVPTMDDGLVIYPNPTGGTLTVESASPIREITVYDLSGRVMMTADGGMVETCHGASLQVDVSSLPNGIYLLRAVTDNGVETGRFVKN